MSAIEKQNELLNIHEQVNEIQAKAERENRELTREEVSQVNQLSARFDDLAGTLGVQEKIQAQSETLERTTGRRTTPIGNARQLPVTPGGRMGIGQQPEITALFRNVATGETVHGYRGITPLSPDNDAPLGDMLAGILLNDFSNLPLDLQASLTTGSDSSGGYLVAPALSQRVIDLARANSVVMRAGAVTVPMGSAEMTLARLTADPSVQWRGETGAVTASTPAFGKYVLRPKTCAALVPVSMELLEDAPNAGTVIQSALMSALGTEVDRVILEGLGSANQLLGIVNNPEVNSQTSIGIPTNYTKLTTAITSILSANFSGQVSDLSWVMNPTIGGVFDGLRTGISSDYTPLEPTPWVRQLQRHYTTNLAASGSPQTYNMVVGDFRECLVGMRTSGVVIDVLDAGQVVDTASTTWNATTQFLRFIRARIRVDAVLMRPTWFSVLSGVRA